MTILFDIRRDARRAVIVGAALLAANALFYALLVRPRILAYQNLEGARLKFQAELGAAEKTQRGLTDFYKKLSTTESNIDEFYAKVLRTKQENLIAVQKEVAEIGEEFGIDPETVSYSNIDLEKDGLENFVVQILLEGGYTELRKFIERVENSRTFLVIDGIGLSGTKEGGLSLQLSINMSTYFNAPWLKETKSSGKARGKRA